MLAAESCERLESTVKRAQEVLGCPLILVNPIDVSFPLERQLSSAPSSQTSISDQGENPQYSWRRKISAFCAYGAGAEDPPTCNSPSIPTVIESAITRVVEEAESD